MKSLKDEIDENLDSFTNSMSQAFRNIRDGISDTVSDAIADYQEQGSGYRRPQKKGCLWPIIKWLLILSVISTLLSECEAEPVVSVDSDSQNTITEDITVTQASLEESKTVNNIYDFILVSVRNNIDTILADSPVDMDSLQSEYEFLLSLKISEYLFKVSAYEHFINDVEETCFNEIVDDCHLIQKEMVQYFPKEEVDSYYTEFIVLSYRSFDESYVDYDSRLIGSEENPDVDAMWLNYVAEMTETAGMDFGNLINQHAMEMYSTLIPAEPEEIQKSESTAPTQSINVEETYIEGYVIYGTGGLNIRNGPGVSYEQIGRLPDGERVIIRETQYSGTAEWGRIERGWICMDYIQIGTPASVGTSAAGETFETDFFFITLPDNCNDKYVLEHNYSSRSEYLVFYYKSEYEYYKGTYSEPGGWPFAIEIRTDGTECSAIAGWDHIGSINIYENSCYELYLHYPMDTQFMDGSYTSFLEDAQSIVDSIAAKDGYEITIF